MSCSDPKPRRLGDWGSSLPHQVSVVLRLPLLGRGGVCLVPGTDSAVSEVVSGQPGQGWFALHPTAIQTATERDPGALTGSADFTVLPGQGPPRSCLKPRLISWLKQTTRNTEVSWSQRMGTACVAQPLLCPGSPLTNQCGTWTGHWLFWAFSLISLMRNLHEVVITGSLQKFDLIKLLLYLLGVSVRAGR